MRLRTCLLSAGLLVLSQSPVFASPVSGHWMTHNSKAMVKITKCGAGLCGQIVWLRQAVDSKGQPVRDIRNRNQALRGRKVLGLTTFSRMSPSGKNTWSGTMYNPNDGRTYTGTITLLNAGALQIHGCRAGGGTCGTRTWKRTQVRAAN